MKKGQIRNWERKEEEVAAATVLGSVVEEGQPHLPVCLSDYQSSFLKFVTGFLFAGIVCAEIGRQIAV